jgi:hypothetical protein
VPKCFYCGAPIGPSNRHTVDHVYPRAILKVLTQPQRATLPAKFHAFNKVSCCDQCNSYKGRLHPLDWLVIMPDGKRAAKLAEHLVRIGEDMNEVFSALQRRRK